MNRLRFLPAQRVGGTSTLGDTPTPYAWVGLRNRGAAADLRSFSRAATSEQAISPPALSNPGTSTEGVGGVLGRIDSLGAYSACLTGPPPRQLRGHSVYLRGAVGFAEKGWGHPV